jgi:hypothetical protein
LIVCTIVVLQKIIRAHRTVEVTLTSTLSGKMINNKDKLLNSVIEFIARRKYAKKSGEKFEKDFAIDVSKQRFGIADLNRLYE